MNGTLTRRVDITDRQRDVIVLIAAGCSNDEVSERLGISPRTVKAHCDVLRQKLGVRRRRLVLGVGAVRSAIGGTVRREA